MLFGLLFLFASVDCSNILGVFTHPFYSHSQYQQSLVGILLSRGHNVTIITEIPFKSHENLTQIMLKDESVELKKTFDRVLAKSFKMSLLDYFVIDIDDYNMMYKQLRNENVQKLIQDGQNNHFDLMIIEQYCFHPLMALAEIYNCPVVMSASMDGRPAQHSMMGNDVNAISNSQTEMMFIERIESVFEYTIELVMISIYDLITSFQIGQHFPTVKATQTEMEDRIALLITNTSPVMGFIRPSTNTLQLSFLHIEPPKPLSDGSLKKFVDNSEKGVIFMSFGSIAKSSNLGPEKIEIFLNVFSRLNYDVVWKFETDASTPIPKNVFMSKWIPQADLLAHSKVKAFITHCGIASTQEAIDRSVPMILIPLYGDQIRNAKIVEARGAGILVDYAKLTENILADAINKILQPKYQRNVEKLRELVYEQPMTSRDQAVWWIEHTIKHKNSDHLKYPGRRVPFHQKYLLDIMLVMVAILFCALKLRMAFKFFIRNVVIKVKQN